MAEVLARIAVALVAVAGLVVSAYELVTHDVIANAAHVAAQPTPAAPQVDAALRDLKRVEDFHPGAQVFMAQAALNLRSRRYAAAERAAQRASELEPKNFSAWVTLAVARARTGDRAGERGAFARAHQLNPLYPIPR